MFRMQFWFQFRSNYFVAYLPTLHVFCCLLGLDPGYCHHQVHCQREGPGHRLQSPQKVSGGTLPTSLSTFFPELQAL